MKVVFFIFSLSSGGAERVTANLANEWAKKGWKITIITLASQELDFYDLSPEVRRIALDAAGRSGSVLQGVVSNLRRIFALRKALRKFSPDIAVGMMSSANIVLAFAALGMGATRLVGSERTHPPRYYLGRTWELLRKVVYSRLDAVVALTEKSAEWIRNNTYARRTVVIPNPIIWPLPCTAPMLDPKTIVPLGKKILLAAGRLGPEKQYHLLLEAFASIALTHPSWDLVILGDGSERVVLESAISDKGLENRVHLPGSCGNIGDWYRFAGLFALTSAFEGFPNTLAEAMAYCVPAVSFDCDTGPGDIIRHGVDGLLVPTGNVEAFSQALERMMSDEQLRTQYSAKAIEIRDRFSYKMIEKQWDRLFMELSDTNRRVKNDNSL